MLENSTRTAAGRLWIPYPFACEAVFEMGPGYLCCARDRRLLFEEIGAREGKTVSLRPPKDRFFG